VTSRVPDVVEAILEVLRAARPTGVLVWDGPVREGDTHDAWFVGHDPEAGAGGESATSERTRTGLADAMYSEIVTVPFGAYCRRDAIKDARRRVYELLALAEAAIYASPNLDLPDVADMEISPTSQLFPWPSRGGVEVRIRSLVAVTVFGNN
jgi:hypothetical protein